MTGRTLSPSLALRPCPRGHGGAERNANGRCRICERDSKRKERGSANRVLSTDALVRLIRATDGSEPCHATDPEAWHSPEYGDRVEAIKACNFCHVYDLCEAAIQSLPTSERYGVWAGQSYGRTHREER